MFQENTSHYQKPLFSDLDNLSDKAQERLEESWAEVFYEEFFAEGVLRIPNRRKHLCGSVFR